MVKWLWGKESYNKWRGYGDKPQSANFLRDRRLWFSASDINHIIIMEEQERSILISCINNLQSIGGGIELTNQDKDMLISKINSIERIKMDY